MTRFSERIGVSQPKSVVQVNDMDIALRNALWNVLISGFLSGPRSTPAADQYAWPYRRLWDEFFHLATDALPHSADAARAEVRAWYFEKAEWWEVYDFLQFAADYHSDEKPRESLSQLSQALRVPGIRKSSRDYFVEKCNAVLERELAGFRFVGGVLIPLVHENQIESVDAARTATSQDVFYPARQHIDTALRLFADRQHPSYRNVIKEAVSAVEAVAQVVAGRPGATLGDALKRIDDAIGVHSALNQGFQKIYGYTSDAEGIRHALSEEETLNQEDALFMIVSCSAFVSYLIAKAQLAGIV